jgi:agmatinase
MTASPTPERQPQEPWPPLKAQPRSFFNAPLCVDIQQLEADVAFIGVPFDQGTLGRPGARFGPDALRDAPRAYSYSDPYGAQGEADGYFDIDAEDELLRGVKMADCGNVPIVPSEVRGNFDRITRAVELAVARGALPAVVGGDHAITFPVVRGLSKFAPLNIVHFDAHLDYTHDVQGVLYTHGSPIRRCHELPFVNHITSIGIRAARRKPYEEAINDGSLIISSNRFRELGPQGVADLIPPAENLYITFDIDVMDPSLAPGTGTPETGGLFYQEVRDCVNALLSKPGASNGGGAARNPLVAFDMVEVAPPYDSSELTVQVAARLILDMLIARFPSR